jgi:hypothetical protein
MGDNSTKMNEFMNTEETMLQNINAYNNAYAQYLICLEPDDNLIVPRPANCSSITPSSQSPTHAEIIGGTAKFDENGNLSSIGNSISSFVTNMNNNIKTQATVANNLVSAATLNANYSEVQSDIKTNYDKINSTRANLDEQLKNLYNIQNSSAYMAGQNIDSSIYAGVLWTILATSFIYYVFTKI